MPGFRRASDAWRRAYAPVLVVGGVAFASLVVQLIDQTLGGPVGDPLRWLFWSLFALVPVAFVFGLFRVRLARTAVAPLMLELGEARTHHAVRDALSRAVDDAELEIVYWRADEQRYIDAAGQAVTLPSTPSRDAGSGLAGLADRIEALEGKLVIASPPGSGTRLRAEIPIGTRSQR